MPRVAFYARYSDDVQNPRSIADQLDLLTRHAAAKGWPVASVFTDAAISGAAMANRPGFLAAVEAAERGEFEVLLSEDEDRLARNLEHLAHAFNRLTWSGVVIATLTKDAIGLMDVAFKGLMGQDFLANLSRKTKRGMHSNAEKGLATGARLYGYSSAPGGRMTIVADQAAVIVRVHEDFAAGDTPRQIAAALNAEGVPGPRGGRWNASSVNGSRQRANGVLHTDLYGGVKVWNRLDVRKDPRTGKRMSRVRPKAEWRRVEVPDLRIVEPALLQAVRDRQAREARSAPVALRRRPGVFSGLLRCGLCGGSYTVYTSGKLICATYREQGSSACSNRRTPRRADVETRALDAIRTKLLSPEAVAAYVAEFHRRAHARKADLAARRGPLERRRAELARGIERIVDRIVDGTVNTAMEQRMAAMDAERLAVEAELAELAQETPPIELHPRTGEHYAGVIAQLQAWLALASTAETRAQRELVDAVRELIVKIEITPLTQARGGPIDLTLYGQLARFLEGGSEPKGNFGLGALVAGGGFARYQPSSALAVATTRL